MNQRQRFKELFTEEMKQNEDIILLVGDVGYKVFDHLREEFPHSQRSVARVSVKFDEMLWIEDLQELCLEALQTETQVMVKREDEQAFAEKNGAYLKFVEDAVRLMYDKLTNESRITDFKIVASHNESLHSHNAVSVIVKGVEGGFTAGVARDVFESTGLR